MGPESEVLGISKSRRDIASFQTFSDSSVSKVISLSSSAREPTLPVLTGSNNLQVWQRRVKATLRARQLWGAVSTKSEGPENDAAAGTIISTVDTCVLHLISSDDYAYDIWNELETLFARNSVTRQVTSFCQLASLKMRSSEDAAKFVSKFRELVSQYLASGGKLSQDQQACFLLNSLNDVFEDLVTHFSLSGDDLSIENIVSAVLAKHDSKEMKRFGAGSATNSVSESALVSETPKKFCRYCKHSGHLIEDCLKLKKKNKQFRSEEANVVPSPINNEDETVLFYPPVHGTWLVDSGATSHMTPKLQGKKTEVTDMEVELGDGRRIQVTGVSSCPLPAHTRVLEVPGLRKQLFSIPQLVEDGGTAYFSKTSSFIELDGRRTPLLHKDRKFELPSSPAEEASAVSAEVWHDRLGHMNSPMLHKIFGTPRGTCEPCQLGKQTRRPYTSHPEARESIVGVKLHADLCGPIKPTGYDDSNYILTLIEDKTRAKHVVNLKAKSDAAEAIKLFLARIENRLGWQLATFRTDRGGEFLNNELRTFFATRGVKHEFTPAYTPQLNGVAERFNRTLLDRARCMLARCRVSKEFWPEVIRHACVVLNRIPHAGLNNKSPFELIFGKPPKLDRMRIFGCQAYVLKLPHDSKLENRAYRGVYLGYDADQHCHRVWDHQTRTLQLVREVSFDETSFPVLSFTNSGQTLDLEVSQEPDAFQPNGYLPTPSTASADQFDTEPSLTQEEISEHPSVQDEDHENPENSISTDFESPPQNPTIEQVPPTNNRPVRHRGPPTGIFSPKWTPGANTATSMRQTSEITPVSFREAMLTEDSSKWKVAAESEFNSMQVNKVWTLVDPNDVPTSRKIMQSKWVFKKKVFQGLKASEIQSANSTQRLHAANWCRLPGRVFASCVTRHDSPTRRLSCRMES